MRSRLEGVLKHDVRLDILCCLADAEALTASQLSARVGKPLAEVSYHLKLLFMGDLIDESDEERAKDMLYTATLDKHPKWVAQVVQDHRPLN